MSNIEPGVIYRAAPLTATEYDKVVIELRAAARDVGVSTFPCVICWADDHAANDCIHNALVMARRGVKAIEREFWRCFHCGYVFGLTQESEARAHFGANEDALAACQRKG